jgi:hypothetical protein
VSSSGGGTRLVEELGFGRSLFFVSPRLTRENQVEKDYFQIFTALLLLFASSIVSASPFFIACLSLTISVLFTPSSTPVDLVQVLAFTAFATAFQDRNRPWMDGRTAELREAEMNGLEATVE